MAISAAERRFLRSWEEQRRGGKTAYVVTYTIGLTVMIFICFVALGLILSIPFIRKDWLISIGVGSVCFGCGISFLLWSLQQKKFRKIINREMSRSN